MLKQTKFSALGSLTLYLTSLVLILSFTQAQADPGSNSPRQNYGPPGAHRNMGSLEGTRHLNEASKGHQTVQSIHHQKPEPSFQSTLQPKHRAVIDDAKRLGQDAKERAQAEQRKKEENAKKVEMKKRAVKAKINAWKQTKMKR